jgi:hypothetical protein
MRSPSAQVVRAALYGVVVVGGVSRTLSGRQLYTITMRCFGTCWDFKDDPPIDEIEERINWLLAHDANEIGLLEADGGDTFWLLISDKRDVPQAIIEQIWNEWWKTRYSDEPEDRHRRLPEDVPLEWPL